MYMFLVIFWALIYFEKVTIESCLIISKKNEIGLVKN